MNKDKIINLLNIQESKSKSIIKMNDNILANKQAELEEQIKQLREKESSRAILLDVLIKNPRFLTKEAMDFLKNTTEPEHEYQRLNFDEEEGFQENWQQLRDQADRFEKGAWNEIQVTRTQVNLEKPGKGGKKHGDNQADEDASSESSSSSDSSPERRYLKLLAEGKAKTSKSKKNPQIPPLVKKNHRIVSLKKIIAIFLKVFKIFLGFSSKII